MIDDDHKDTFNEQYKIKSARNIKWNYSSSWWYLVTICTVHHNKFFGKIVDSQMVLSKMGLIADNCIKEIPKHFSNVYMEDFMVMPNHVHMLIKLKYSGYVDSNDSRAIECVSVETPYMASLQKTNGQKADPEYFYRIGQKSKQMLPKVVQQYKSAVTRLVNPRTTFFGWQERYHEEIIKDAKHFQSAKYYIKNNIKNWSKDKENV
ncbi:hypothetical protein KBC75_02560 [Candidatus Shapirobacteria bacterium]|nr:hypothetical protein [Candidatus Shapirobacteria bacterium]